MTERKVQLHRGLREVYIDRTTSSFIDGDEGKLLYRGYNIHELAQNSTFEETAFLVMNGHLPTQAELDAFDAELKSSRSAARRDTRHHQAHPQLPSHGRTANGCLRPLRV